MKRSCFNGVCDAKTMSCICKPGFQGQQCQYGNKNGNKLTELTFFFIKTLMNVLLKMEIVLNFVKIYLETTNVYANRVLSCYQTTELVLVSFIKFILF